MSTQDQDAILENFRDAHAEDFTIEIDPEEISLSETDSYALGRAEELRYDLFEGVQNDVNRLRGMLERIETSLEGLREAVHGEELSEDKYSDVDETILSTIDEVGTAMATVDDIEGRCGYNFAHVDLESRMTRRADAVQKFEKARYAAEVLHGAARYLSALEKKNEALEAKIGRLETEAEAYSPLVS
jgi:hypothetical protein